MVRQRGISKATLFMCPCFVEHECCYMNVKLFFCKVHHCGLLALTLALLSVSLAAKNYLASCYELIKAPYHIYAGYEDKKDEVTADIKAMPSAACATGVIAWAVTPLPGWFQHLIASIMEGRVST